MPSLTSPLARPPSEDLHTSRALVPSCARRVERKHSIWRLGTWTVRTLVDTEKSVETDRQGREVYCAEDRGIDLVVHELNRYDVKAAALQETLWFGSNVYHVGESLVLASGRPVPAAGEPMKRGEGVAIVLSGPAVSAWRAAGERWKSWSPRLISAHLKTGKRRNDHLHIISAYAPTRAASREAKDKFFQDLDQVLSSIPSNEPYVLLGDFNAHVGSRDEDDAWGRVRGPYGYGETNDAGTELLTFLAAQEVTICNTWFQKKDIYKQTWKHPRSKRWHCIDFIAMRQKDRGQCSDVVVKRGAVGGTDHQLLCAKIRVSRSKNMHNPAHSRAGRFDVAKLARNVDNTSTLRKSFRDQVIDRVTAEWPSGGSAEMKWGAIKGALTSSAESILGTADR